MYNSGKLIATDFVTRYEIDETKRHEQFSMLLRFGSASLACTLVAALSIGALSICTRKIGIFFHLYLSLILADCLLFVASYFHHRLPDQNLLLPFYTSIAGTIDVNRLVFASFYGQFAHRLATMILSVGWSLSVCLRPLGIHRTKRKVIQKYYSLAGIVSAWLLSACFALSALFEPLDLIISQKAIIVQAPPNFERTMCIVVTTVTVASTVIGIGSLILGLTYLRSKNKLKSTTKEEYKKIAILCIFNGLLVWLAANLIRSLSREEKERKSIEKADMPLLIDVNTVIKHWCLVALVLIEMIQRIAFPRYANRVASLSTSTSNRTPTTVVAINRT